MPFDSLLHDRGSQSADDDMPALVDNPNPSSLTYTFCSVTPHSYPSTTTIQTSSSNPPSPLTPDDSITHHLPMSHSRGHGKRRDPSYIPRPSNAFILFRSAFIRDRKVSDKVEGNHSSLSKIIGHSWKKLSPDEREKWEAEAVAAQAQHRAMYPDWRFRPGANALAKLKIKDGGTADRQGAEKAAKGKGKGRNKSSARTLSLEEMRCAKIADFVADGIRGEELEVAVKQWEGDRKMGKEKLQRPGLSASSSSSHARSHSYTTSNMESSSISDNHYPRNSPPDPQLVVVDPVPRPGSWDDYSPLVMEVSPTWTHAHVHEGQDSFPMPASQFDGGYVEYGSFDPPHDGSQNVEWTDLSNSGSNRHGLVTVLDNPYKDDSNPTSPDVLTPPTSYAPPLSNSYYYSQVSPSSSLPSSAFSTLTGWAGDYKTQTSTWPDPPSTWGAPPPSSSSSTSSSNWYSSEGSFDWNGGRFEHGYCPTLDSQDWDRLEYRTATDLHLPVEPLRPMTFDDEIRRLHGNSP